MTAPTPEPESSIGHKICTTCARRLPLAMFRRYRAGEEPRRPQCRDCRTAQEQARRGGADRRLIAAYFTELRRRSSPDQLRLIVETVADYFGGLNRFCAMLARMLMIEAPARWHLTVATALLHMFCVAENARLDAKLQSQPVFNCEEQVRQRHAEGRLLLVLRKLYFEGQISPDDLEPPPFEGE